MTEEMRKRLEEAADKYIGHPFEVDEGTTVSMRRQAFQSGAELGYKEAIAQAKEWIRDRNRHACQEWLDKECTDFEADMNKLWEEQK